MTEHDLRKIAERLPLSESTRRRNQAGGVPSAPECERDSVHEPVGKDAREIANQGRRHVRITGYRLRLCDERNLWDKHFVDSLVEAGVLIDDSPQCCKVEVTQIKVYDPALVRTEIEITTPTPKPQPALI